MEQNHQSLYRVYRPNSFNDVAGHSNIVEILKTQLEQQSFGHAFLFAGQRGTGKTSIARILAKAVNCLNLEHGNPCNKCNNCLAFNDNKFSDVYEIDAASNNGVDEIRNIKANVSTLPIVGQYKVYIIDEVHMLTKGAFNALLKTLEEPPTHVIFILATTEYDKIPQTITSRCQSFNFKKINQLDLVNRLNYICKQEGFELDLNVGREIYQLSDGSLRDALNVLEQLMILSSDHHLTLTNLKKIFYVTTKEEKIFLLTKIFNQDATQTITYFEKARSQGLDFESFALSLLKIIKEIIEYKLTNNASLLNEVELKDIEELSQVKIADWFLLSDYLTSAYSRTKNRSVSYDAIILSIIQSIQNFSQIYHFENELNDQQTEEIIEAAIEPITNYQEKEVIKQEPQIQWTQDIIRELAKEDTSNEPVEVIVESTIKQEPIEEFDDEDLSLSNETEVSLEMNEDTIETEPTLIDNFINENKPKLKDDLDDEIPSNLLGLIRKQNQLMMHQDHLDQKIEFLLEDLINVLRGAVVDQTIMLRKELSTKLEEIFSTNDQSDLLKPIQANKFIAFYNSKIVVANKNELIITVDDETNASFINYWLIDSTNRQEIFKLFGHDFAIYAISEETWNQTKTTHVNLKEKKLLPEYHLVNLNEFYQKNYQLINKTNSLDNQDLFDKVADLFGSDDIKIG